MFRHVCFLYRLCVIISYCCQHACLLCVIISCCCDDSLKKYNLEYLLTSIPMWQSSPTFISFVQQADYEDLTDTYYLSQAENLDIRFDTDNSRDHINKWVASQTNNEITNLLSDLDSGTSLVLVNAITFKGEWVKKFEATYTGPFHLTSSNAIQTTMMKMGCRPPMMKHADIPVFDAQILELPYKGNKVSMYILRPNHIEGLAYMENQLNLATLNAAISSMTLKPIDVALPKFSLSQTIDLKPILKALGMFDVFSVFDADLHKIGTGNGKLWVDFVVHQAIINVHENGTEASAATTVGVCRVKRTAPPPIPYNVDRPFIFFIREQTSGSILFMGRLVEPEAAAAIGVGIGKGGDFAQFARAKPDRVVRKG